jgi:hypothetical protein
VTSTLFAAGNTRTNKEEALGLKLFGAADGIGIMRVTAVNDNIATLEERFELIDEIVYSTAGLDEKNDFAGSFEFGSEFLDRVCTLNFSTCSLEV